MGGYLYVCVCLYTCEYMCVWGRVCVGGESTQELSVLSDQFSRKPKNALKK